MARKNATTKATTTPAPTAAPAPTTPAPTAAPATTTTDRDTEYRNAFGVVYVQDGTSEHGTGTAKPMPIVIDDRRRNLQVPGDGYRMLVMRIWPDSDEIVGMFNHDHDRVRACIEALQQQKTEMSDPDTLKDVNAALASYAGNPDYPSDRVFIRVCDFVSQMKKKRSDDESDQLQMVTKLGSGIDGKAGIPVFGKNGVPQMPLGDRVWRLCLVCLMHHGGTGIAIAIPDIESIDEVIADLTVQDEAIAKMEQSAPLKPVNGEAKKIAHDLLALAKGRRG